MSQAVLTDEPWWCWTDQATIWFLTGVAAASIYYITRPKSEEPLVPLHKQCSILPASFLPGNLTELDDLLFKSNS